MPNTTKILIVDDEYLLRQGLKYLCNWEQEGFTIVGEASTGEEGLSLTKKLEPNIIITDIVMPEMDGIEFIKLVKLYDPTIQIVVLSSHSNFDYVKSSFKYGVNDYILKPKLNPTDLLAILRGLQPNTPNDITLGTDTKFQKQVPSIIEKIINGFNCDDEDWQDLDQYFPLDHFIILVTTINNTNSSLWETTLPQQLSEYTYSDFVTKDGTYAVLINYSNAQSISINEALCQLTDELHCNVKFSHFAISPVFSTLKDLEALYINVTNLLSYKFFLEDIVLITPRHLPKISNTISFDVDNFRLLIECLNIDEAKQLILSHIQEVAKTLDHSVFSLKKLVENTIYNSINILQKLDFDTPSFNALKLRSLKSIESTVYVSQLLQTTGSILDEFSKEINLQPETKNRMVINKITSYVENNYQEQIHLSAIAEKLHLNYSYLSSYFNNHAKESFTDYVNKVRISKAKELLVDPNISISEISELVGYSDQSYFGKVFKKATGFTPSTYRKKHLTL